MLRLSAPVNEERPFLWRTEDGLDSPALKPGGRGNLIVIGNPGRAGDFDPLFTREAKMVSGRPDELELNIELKPGYSGGPVCLADTGEVAGLVSYKIVSGASYQDTGRTFAKSVALADDALENWMRRSPESQQARVDRLAQQFERQYGHRCALNAALNVYYDSAVYTVFCMEVFKDYHNYMEMARRKIPPNLSRGLANARIRKAHSEYIRDRGPKKAKEVREKITPRLREETEKWYQAAVSDETLPDVMKKQLQSAYEAYSHLKGTAEQIVAERPTGGSSSFEFLEAVGEWWQQAQDESRSVIHAARTRLE